MPLLKDSSLKNIVSRLLLPLVSFNLTGLAAGGLWLGVSAQWQVVWVGFVMVLFAPAVIPIFMIPAGILSHFMSVYHAQQKPDREKMMFLLSLLYLSLFLSFWSVGTFEFVMHSVQPRAVHAGLLWGATTAVAPLLLWSSRDRNNIFIMTMVEVAQGAMFVLVAVRLLAGVSFFWPSFAIFAAIVIAAAAAQAVYEEKYMNTAKEPPR